MCGKDQRKIFAFCKELSILCKVELFVVSSDRNGRYYLRYRPSISYSYLHDMCMYCDVFLSYLPIKKLEETLQYIPLFTFFPNSIRFMINYNSDLDKTLMLDNKTHLSLSAIKKILRLAFKLNLNRFLILLLHFLSFFCFA